MRAAVEKCNTFILLFPRNISPAGETIQWGAGAILGAGELDLGPLRLQVHLPQEGFVAGVGVDGVKYRINRNIKNKRVLIVNRLLKPIKTLINFFKTTMNLRKKYCWYM